MTNPVATSLYNKLSDEFDTRKHKLNGHGTDHLSLVRNSAFEVFKSKGFPSIKEEDWRFTSLAPFLEENFSFIGGVVNEAQLQQAISEMAIPSLDAYQLILVNGSIHFGLSQLPDDKKISIQSLQSISNTDLFKENSTTPDHVGGKSMVALNTAFFTDGVFFEIKKDAVLDKPLQIIHIYSGNESMFFQPRHLVVVNQNAKAEIIESSVALKNESVVFVNSVSEFLVKENAQLVHYHIQSNAPKERWVNYTQVIQHRNSRFDNFTFSLPGADLIRNNLEIKLNGVATETHMYGLYLVGAHQLTDNHTSIDHNYPNCNSNEIYKGVLMENGRAVFNGKVFVEREAQKTNAFQQNNNLLLSNKAQVYAKPQLEIFADDVKCSHGCTVGQFDPESLFYLRSRGIGEEAARKILVEAFMFDVTDKISNPAVKKFLKRLIYDKLGQSNELPE